MTRLEEHQKREARKRMLLFGVVMIALIALVSYGLPVIINLSSTVGKSLGSKSATIEQKNNLEFSTVQINNIPDATNSASLVVSGSVANLDNLTIYLNGQTAQKIDVSGKSDFNTQVDGLKKGTNEIYASGTRKGATDTRETQKYTVTYRADKPNLSIDSPTDNSTTPRNEIQVTGKTDPNTDLTLKVNGQPTVIAADGGYRASVKLNEGDNEITVNVSDSAGNSEEKKVHVKYEK